MVGKLDNESRLRLVTGSTCCLPVTRPERLASARVTTLRPPYAAGRRADKRQNFSMVIRHFGAARLALASLRMGMSVSASFHNTGNAAGAKRSVRAT